MSRLARVGPLAGQAPQGAVAPGGGGGTPPAEGDPFLPEGHLVFAHFHAVWDKTGPSFGAVHRDIIDKLAAAGIQGTRIDVAWPAFEPTKGSFRTRPYGGKLEDSLSYLRTKGMRAIIVLNESPLWSHPDKTIDNRYLPNTPSDYAGIAKWFSEYLAPWNDVLLGVEVFNEANLQGFDRAGPRPAHYTDCIRAYYNAAKASANPRLPVIFGAPAEIAVDPTLDPLNNRTNFIGYCYDRVRATTPGSFPWDRMAVHIYPAANRYTATPDYVAFHKHIPALINRMQLEGDTSPIFNTETGHSAHANVTGVQPSNTGVTLQQQADWTVEDLQGIRRDWPQFRMSVIYNDWEKGAFDTGTQEDREQNGFGLLTFDPVRGTAKPIYQALKAYLTGASSPPPPGSWPTATTKLCNLDPDLNLLGLSGMVMSGIHPNVAYVVDDHGSNVVFMVDVRAGTHLGTITLNGATVLDWEDITRGPGNTILVGDIGDNALTRTNYRLYSFPEPSVPGSVTLTPTVFPVSYSDGLKHNPESLLWDPTSGRFYIHTKISTTDATARWCEGPAGALSTTGNVFTLTSRAHGSGNAFGGDWTTDGSKYVLQKVGKVSVYDRAGSLLAETPYPMTALPQAESVTWVPGNSGVLVSSEQFAGPPVFYLPV